MHDKILSIAADHTPRPYAETWVFDDETLVAFAKEVILECCAIVQSRHGSSNNPHDCPTVLDIKECFGIEPNQNIQF